MSAIPLQKPVLSVLLASLSVVGFTACSDIKLDMDFYPEIRLSSNTKAINTPGNLNLSAIAKDDKGVTKVEFFENGNKISESTNAPYAFSKAFTLADNGTKSYSAKATDSIGQVTDSAVVEVVVNIADTLAPTVSLAASNANVILPGSVLLSATAEDSVGVTKIEFFEGANLLATDSSAPYEFSADFVFANNGTHAYTAKAFDAAGNTTTSAAQTVVVAIPDTAAPTVSLVAANANVIVSGAVILTANAQDNVGITKIEFFEGATLLATDTSAPYEFVANYVFANNGMHNYTAKAFDAADNTTTSAVSAITVNIPDTTPPTVSLNISNAIVITPSSIALTATASDNVGVTKVDFYDGTILIGTDSTAPYTLAPTFVIANNGTHNYTAKAFDGAGNSTTSAVNAVAVNIPDTSAPTNPVLAITPTVTPMAVDLVLTATAQDDVGVAKVEFFDGNTLEATVTSAPFIWAAHYERPDNGSNSYTAKIYDAAGNMSNATNNYNVNIASGTLLYGTVQEDRVWSTVVDAQGNMYVGGCKGAGYVTVGPVSVAVLDSSITKISATGSTLWTKTFTVSNFNDCINGLALTPDGTGVIGVGYSVTTVYATLPVSYDSDFFVMKLNTATGNQVFNKLFGSAAGDNELNDVALDSAGNIYATGFAGANLFAGQNNVGGLDAMLVKYDAAGTLVWGRNLGTAQTDLAEHLVVAPNGEIIIVGQTNGKIGAAQRGGTDHFLARYNASGTKLAAEQFGSAQNEGPVTEAIVDANSNVYFSGSTTGGYEGQTLTGALDGLVVKHNSAGGLAWVKQFGQAGANIQLNGLVLDATGNIFAAGTTDAKLAGQNSYGGNDVFLAKLVAATGAMNVLTQFGGSGSDSSYDLVANGNKFVLTGLSNAALDGKSPVGDFDIFHLIFDGMGRLH